MVVNDFDIQRTCFEPELLEPEAIENWTFSAKMIFINFEQADSKNDFWKSAENTLKARLKRARTEQTISTVDRAVDDSPCESSQPVPTATPSAHRPVPCPNLDSYQMETLRSKKPAQK